MKNYLLLSLLFSIFFLPAYSQRINEFHYANTSVTKTGFVEVLVPASYTAADFAATTLTLYSNQDADPLVEEYFRTTLDKFKVGTPYNNFQVLYIDIPIGLADPIGGISLSYDGGVIFTLIQFLSYGTGTPLVAKNGPAAGTFSTPISETEEPGHGANNSLFLPENVFLWANYKANTNTKGIRNGDYNVVQPVELLSFVGKQTTKGVLLTWATAMEKNNEKFVVERSNEVETNFIAIAEIKGQGSTLQEQQYQYIDNKPVTGTTFYRLKQVDFDGTTSYFKIIAVKPKEVDNLLVYPNPTTDNMLVAFKGKTGGTIQIFNKTGQIVYQKELGNSLTNTTSLQLDNLPAGTYFLILERGKERQSKTFVKL